MRELRKVTPVFGVFYIVEKSTKRQGASFKIECLPIKKTPKTWEKIMATKNRCLTNVDPPQVKKKGKGRARGKDRTGGLVSMCKKDGEAKNHITSMGECVKLPVQGRATETKRETRNAKAGISRLLCLRKTLKKDPKKGEKKEGENGQQDTYVNIGWC